MATLNRALEIAREAHRGQVDKAGADYVTHPARVAERVDGETAKIVALLHDVIEDGPGWSLQRLRDEGFPDEVVAAVDGLTRRNGEDYFDFVRRADADPLARAVKIADLEDNMDRTRLGEITPEDETRLARYAAALKLVQPGQQA